MLLEGDTKDVGNVLDVSCRRHLQSSAEQNNIVSVFLIIKLQASPLRYNVFVLIIEDARVLRVIQSKLMMTEDDSR